MENPTKPLPNDEFLPHVHLYGCEHLYIGVPKSEMTMFPGTHSHEGYEFLFPLIDMPSVVIGKKNLNICRNQVLPVNPGQEHGVSELVAGARFVDMVIDSSFLEQTAESTLSKKNTGFRNEGYMLSSRLQHMIEMYLEEGRLCLPGRKLILESLGVSITVNLLRELQSSALSSEKVSMGQYTFKMKQVIDYIHENYKNDCSLKELADLAEFSSYHFIRVFKGNTGKTPYEYLIDLKIDEVKKLLVKKDMTIMEICFECGFNNFSHFTRLFKKKTGVTPSEYRASILR